MVYAIGIDLIEIERIRKGYNRFGDRYLTRLFTPAEIDIIRSRKAGMITTMAGKFAAKEAVMKALGVFFDSGVALRDIEILNHPSGMPYVKLPQKLQDAILNKEIIISISHEKRYAVANAVITDKE